MGKVIVVEFVTLDGVVEDPDGSGDLPGGGWARHAGPEIFTGDKFGLGPLLEGGAMLFGRRTWEVFAQRWPKRTGDFPDVMNRTPKFVVSNQPPPLDAWNGSTALVGDLIEAVAEIAATRDLVVVGSTNVVHQLATADVVDEYRLITIPIVVGAGIRLFEAPVALRQVAVEPGASTTLVRYERARDAAA